MDIDVAIVGGGVAGCIAAARLRQLGLRVRVIDRFAAPRNEFRAEQLVGPQIDKLRQLGLFEFLASNPQLAGATLNVRRGAILDRTRVEQFGMSYRSMVAAVRAILPSETFVSARVARVETGPCTQSVCCADGQVVTARLVILATGLMPHLPKQLGIDWEMVSEAHSLCLGFDLAIDDLAGSASVPLIYYGERSDDRIDYIALFHIEATIRANLFCYRPRDDDWVLDFMARPDTCLGAAVPGLSRIIGAWQVSQPVECRSNDIKIAVNVIKDGVVLIGDAFQTPCPAAGTGIDRILSDVDTLGRLLPSWFDSSGMGADKITQFYVDPVKRAFDAECLRIALYRRDFSTNTGLSWRLHRSRVLLQRRFLRALKDSWQTMALLGKRETAHSG